MLPKTLTRHATRGVTFKTARPIRAKAPARLISAAPAIIQAPPPLLELHLHLHDGTTRTFVQNDKKLVRQIVPQIGPCLFSQPALLLYGQDQVTAFPGSALVGVSLLMDPMPDELLQLEPFPCFEITHEDYQAARQAAKGIAEEDRSFMAGAIEMDTGRHFWIAVPVSQTRWGFAERQMLHTLLSLPCIICRRVGGGISLWNRSQIRSCSFSPGEAFFSPGEAF